MLCKLFAALLSAIELQEWAREGDRGGGFDLKEALSANLSRSLLERCPTETTSRKWGDVSRKAPRLQGNRGESLKRSSQQNLTREPPRRLLGATRWLLRAKRHKCLFAKRHLGARRVQLPGDSLRGGATHGERDAACPVSTGRGTRRVRLVRGEGRGVSG